MNALAGMDADGVLSFPLADGDAGTEETLRHIRRLVEAGKKNPAVRNKALSILHAADPLNQRGYDHAFMARAILEAVIREFRYVPDPVDKEMLQAADYMILQTRAGDCDDLNGVLLPSLLLSVGIPARLVTISTHSEAPEEFTHIYAEAQVNGHWLPMDAARSGARWLRQPGRYFRRRLWSLADGSFQDVRGLAGYHVPQRRTMGAMPRRIVVRRRNGQPLSGMGFDWGMITNLINVGGQTAANLIAATKSPTGFIPQASAGATAAPAYATVSNNSTPLLIGGALLLVVMLSSQRGY